MSTNNMILAFSYLYSIRKATPKEVWPWPANSIFNWIGQHTSY